MYDLVIDFIMCNIVLDFEFVFVCMVIIVMQYLMNKINILVFIIFYSIQYIVWRISIFFFKKGIVRLFSVKFVLLIKNISFFNKYLFKKYVIKDFY